MYPFPADEDERLATLDRLAIFDTGPEAGFERIVKLAQDLSGTPIALISLMDRERLWFKAKVGIACSETPRALAFCNYTILSDRPMVVPDASLDPRFGDNPLVIGPPHIRYYAGAPIIDPHGIRLGTLCVIDQVPRLPRAQELERLSDLAQMVADQIELRRTRTDLLREFGLRTATQERLREQDNLLERRQRLMALTSRLAKVGGWEFDLQAMQLSWSEEVFRIHELEADGEPDVETAIAFYPPHAQAVLRQSIDRTMRTGEAYDLELPLVTARGNPRWVRTIGEVEMQDGVPVKLFGTFQDCTEAREREGRITHLATHDALTGLPNRHLLQERLEVAVATARHEGKLAAVLLIDVDHLKDINDSFGHAAGDAVLKAMAARLLPSVRPVDAVARHGGDGFAVLLTELNRREEAEAVMQRLITTLALPAEHAGQSVQTSVSIGLAIFPQDAQHGADLLRDADIALHRAKSDGRARGTGLTPAMKAEVKARRELELDLRQAIEAEAFTMAYQPKLVLPTGAVEGFEALVRWHHPTRGDVRPDAFIDVVEQAGLALPFDMLVLRMVARQTKEWLEAGLEPGRVAVNLSPALCRSPDFADRVLAVLAEIGLPPERIEVELTERVFLGSAVEAMNANLCRLHAAGMLISFDDFGTGYASLIDLKRFPVDRLKIDRSFIRDIEQDPNDAAIVQAVIRLSHGLGLKVVAEGVETEAQMGFLLRHGCDMAQGYRFSRPLAPASVPGFLADQPTLASGLAQRDGAAGRRRGLMHAVRERARLRRTLERRGSNLRPQRLEQAGPAAQQDGHHQQPQQGQRQHRRSGAEQLG